MEVRGKEKIRLGCRGYEKVGVGEEGGGCRMRRWEYWGSLWVGGGGRER